MREMARFLSSRFGVPDAFLDGLALIRRGKEVWVSSTEASETDGPILRRGIMLARMTTDGWKLTAEGAMIIGKEALACVVDLCQKEAAIFLSGQDIEGDFPWPDGQVIVRYRGFPVGVGLLRGRVIKNQLRASRRLPPRKR